MSKEVFVFLNWFIIIFFILFSLFITFKVIGSYSFLLKKEEANKNELAKQNLKLD